MNGLVILPIDQLEGIAHDILRIVDIDPQAVGILHRDRPAEVIGITKPERVEGKRRAQSDHVGQLQLCRPGLTVDAIMDCVCGNHRAEAMGNNRKQRRLIPRSPMTSCILGELIHDLEELLMDVPVFVNAGGLNVSNHIAYVINHILPQKSPISDTRNPIA